MRDEIFNYVDCDVFFVSETHLKKGEDIKIENFSWMGQSRSINVKKNQKRVMGGVGFLIKKCLYTDYHIKCIDNKFEGILVFSFVNKITDINLTIIGVYLPPENSFHGRNGDMYFNYINTLFFEYKDESDILMLCGDMNARIGDMNDIKDDCNVFDIKTRLTCENITNRHGNCLLDFLYDNDICVLNGRFGLESNKFTSISTRGRAVVDYIILPHDFCKQF